MNSVSLAPSREAAHGGDFGPDITGIQTLGYFAPGDGGGAIYRPVARPPTHRGALLTADGRWWEISGGNLDVRQFGAVGDGVTDDTEAIQAALDCSLAATVLFSPGRYRAHGLRLRRPCTIVGSSAELVGTGAAGGGDLLMVHASDFEMRQLTLRGDVYETFETPVAPYALLRIDQDRRDRPEIQRVSIVDVNFIGGRVGCFIGLASDILVDRVRFERCRDYALILAVGPRRIVVRGLIARDIGLYGGVKTSYNGTLRATEKFVLCDFIIERCGRLDPDPRNWQEGLDLVAAYARQFIVANGIISDCGNGALELKTGATVTELDETYEDILITGVVMDVVGDRHAVAMNWTGRKTNTDKRGRKVLITNCTIRFSGANRTQTDAAGIVITAWSDVQVVNNVIEGCGAAIVLEGRGAANDTVQSVVIAGNQIRAVGRGVYARVGRVEDLAIDHNSIEAEFIGVGFEGSIVDRAQISHNSIRQSAWRHTSKMAAIFMRDASQISIWHNTLVASGGYPVLVVASRNVPVGGEIAGNQVRAEQDAFRLEAGHWSVLENRLRLPPQSRTIARDGVATVAAGWNVRGLALDAPYAAGSPGDIFVAAASGARQPLGWRLELDHGPSGASWRPFSGDGAGTVHALGAPTGSTGARLHRWFAKSLQALAAQGARRRGN